VIKIKFKSQKPVEHIKNTWFNVGPFMTLCQFIEGLIIMIW